MKIYISGKITGLPNHVAAANFSATEQVLKEANYTPVNPMEICPYHPDHTWKHYMIEDIKALLECDAIFMMMNWIDSKGAMLEHEIAVALGLKVIYESEENLIKI